MKNGQQNWETTQHPLLNSINPIKEARVSGERVRQMLWSGSLPGGLEKIKNARSGNKAFPEDRLSSKPGVGVGQGVVKGWVSVEHICFSVASSPSDAQQSCPLWGLEFLNESLPQGI